jgi:uncharacterized protein (DUF697 family)
MPPKKPRNKKPATETPADILAYTQADIQADTPPHTEGDTQAAGVSGLLQTSQLFSPDTKNIVGMEIDKESGNSKVTKVRLETQGGNTVADTVIQDHVTHDTAPDSGMAAEELAAAKASADAAIKKLKADVVITRHVAVAVGAGLIPVPIIDFAAITAVQLTMVAQICSIYSQPFSKEAVTGIIASLAGGAVTGSEAGSMALAARLKFLPVVGTILGFLVTPAVAGATTYAIGKVFVHHLATGGTILTFEAKKMKEYMEKSLQEGKKLVPHWGAAAAPTTAASQ